MIYSGDLTVWIVVMNNIAHFGGWGSTYGCEAAKGQGAAPAAACGRGAAAEPESSRGAGCFSTRDLPQGRNRIEERSHGWTWVRTRTPGYTSC